MSSPERRPLLSTPLPTLEQLDEFHKVIDCVLAIDVPLDCNAITLADSKESVRTRIERVKIQSGSDKPDRPADWMEGLPDSYVDSLAVFISGGDADVVLDRLTIRSKTESQLTRLVRSTWIYLAWMILLAAGGIAIYAKFSLPAIHSMRVDMTLLPRHLLRPPAAWFPYAWMIVAALTWLAIGLMIASTVTRFPAWSAGWFGGNRYRELRMQKIQSRVRSSLAVKEQELGDGGSAYLLDQRSLQNQAVSQITRLRVLVPIILIVVVGGLGVMLYCWMLFVPLVALIYDLSAGVVGEGVSR